MFLHLIIDFNYLYNLILLQYFQNIIFYYNLHFITFDLIIHLIILFFNFKINYPNYLNDYYL